MANVLKHVQEIVGLRIDELLLFTGHLVVSLRY
jgi:hypothetical protein